MRHCIIVSLQDKETGKDINFLNYTFPIDKVGNSAYTIIVWWKCLEG